MIDRVTLEHASLLLEMIAQYQNALEVAESQLDRLTLERAVRQFCREYLEMHGGDGELSQLCLEIHDLEHHIKSKEQLIARMRELLEECAAKLRARQVHSGKVHSGKEQS